MRFLQKPILLIARIPFVAKLLLWIGPRVMPKHRDSGWRVFGLIVFLGLAFIFVASSLHHVQIALDGRAGYARSGLIGEVYVSFIAPVLGLPMDNVEDYFAGWQAMIWLLTVIEIAILFFFILSKRFKPLAIAFVAAFIFAVSALVSIANPEVSGIECECTGIALLDFSESWKVLLRNGAMILSALWLAATWFPRTMSSKVEELAEAPIGNEGTQ